MNLNIKNIYAWPLTTRLLILGLLFAVIFYLGYLWDLSSLRTELADVTQQENEIKQQIESVIKKEASIRNELSQFDILKKTLSIWQQKLVDYNELPSLLNEVLKIGATNHLYFALFNPESEEREDIYAKLPIKVIAVGNYHQIALFLSQVVNMPWIVVIGDFILTNENRNDVLGARLAEQANAQRLITAEVKLIVFYIPEKNIETNDTKPITVKTPTSSQPVTQPSSKPEEKDAH